MYRFCIPFYVLLAFSPLAYAEQENQQEWGFKGMFGQFERDSLKRGYTVYRDVCSNCHSLSMLSFRNLTDIGFSVDEAKAIAAGYNVQDGPNDSGEMFERPARLTDQMPSPFKNEQQAAFANNGVIPPDLSLIIKARHDGANYVYNLLTGYSSSVPDEDGLFENKAFPTGRIAMLPPLSDDLVSFDDGTKATVSNMASDVVEFLAWASQPELNERHRLGMKVMIFLVITTILFFIANRSLWNRIKKR